MDAPSLGWLVLLAAIASTAPPAETQKRLHIQFDKQCFLTWMAVEISGSSCVGLLASLAGPYSAMQWELGAWKRWARVSQHKRKRRHTGRQRRPKHETLHSRPNCRVNDARLPVKRSGGEFRQLIKCAAAGQNTPRIYQGHELHP